jgi:penicillin-binding protein 2
MFAALGTRLWFVQVLASAQAQQDAKQNGTRLVPLSAPRGRILDRKGVVLVQNRPSLVVTVNRQDLGDQEETLLYRLARLLQMPVGDLLARLNTKRYFVYTPVPVAFDVPKETALYIGEHQWQFPGVQTEELTVRSYPFGELAAHELGYVGQISSKQLEDPRFGGYDPNDTVGKQGVEAAYEHDLIGTKGVLKLRVNSAGKNLGPFGREPPVPGHDVVLSISERVQRLAERSLVLGMEAARSSGLVHANAGAVAVMNPDNGQIIALASKPGYDPGAFEGGSPKEVTRLLNSTRHPLLNRATQGAYPPGSTFKPFVALSALKEGIARLNKFYPCPPTYSVPTGAGSEPTIKRNWTTRDFGSITLAEALTVSCDTVFYPFGYAFWQRFCALNGDCFRDQTSGKGDIFQRDLRTFGFGQPAGSDFPESTGIIPTPQWKFEHKLPNPDAVCDRTWCPGDDINMSIGQGDVQVTPLQLAVAYSAIANGGTVWQPHVGLRVQDSDGNVVSRIRPTAIGKLPFTKKQLSYVRQALTGVVGKPEGTAYAPFRDFPMGRIPVAGKTGTAQVPSKDDYSWFAAMAPANHPRFVVVALVEQGGHGSQTAAPVVRRILDGLFGLRLTNPHTGVAAD